MQEKKRDRVTGVLLWTAAALIGLLAVGAALMLAGVAGALRSGRARRMRAWARFRVCWRWGRSAG